MLSTCEVDFYVKLMPKVTQIGCGHSNMKDNCCLYNCTIIYCRSAKVMLYTSIFKNTRSNKITIINISTI